MAKILLLIRTLPGKRANCPKRLAINICVTRLLLRTSIIYFQVPLEVILMEISLLQKLILLLNLNCLGCHNTESETMIMVTLGETIAFDKHIDTLSTKLMNVSDQICLVLHSIWQKDLLYHSLYIAEALAILFAPRMMIQCTLLYLNLIRPGLSLESFSSASSLKWPIFR